LMELPASLRMELLTTLVEDGDVSADAAQAAWRRSGGDVYFCWPLRMIEKQRLQEAGL
jgi:hypothetical protein